MNPLRYFSNFLNRKQVYCFVYLVFWNWKSIFRLYFTTENRFFGFFLRNWKNRKIDLGYKEKKKRTDRTDGYFCHRLSKLNFYLRAGLPLPALCYLLAVRSSFINLRLFRSLKLLFYQRSVEGRQPARQGILGPPPRGPVLKPPLVRGLVTTLERTGFCS